MGALERAALARDGAAATLSDHAERALQPLLDACAENPARMAAPRGAPMLCEREGPFRLRLTSKAGLARLES